MSGSIHCKTHGNTESCCAACALLGVASNTRAATTERARIVAWLRECCTCAVAAVPCGRPTCDLADAIERGDHAEVT